VQAAIHHHVDGVGDYGARRHVVAEVACGKGALGTRAGNSGVNTRSARLHCSSTREQREKGRAFEICTRKNRFDRGNT
jgi:hypothetical protein